MFLRLDFEDGLVGVSCLRGPVIGFMFLCFVVFIIGLSAQWSGRFIGWVVDGLGWGRLWDSFVCVLVFVIGVDLYCFL